MGKNGILIWCSTFQASLWGSYYVCCSFFPNAFRPLQCSVWTVCSWPRSCVSGFSLSCLCFLFFLMFVLCILFVFLRLVCPVCAVPSFGLYYFPLFWGSLGSFRADWSIFCFLVQFVRLYRFFRLCLHRGQNDSGSFAVIWESSPIKSRIVFPACRIFSTNVVQERLYFCCESVALVARSDNSTVTRISLMSSASAAITMGTIPAVFFSLILSWSSVLRHSLSTSSSSHHEVMSMYWNVCIFKSDVFVMLNRLDLETL